MTRVADLVATTVKEITGQLKEIKQSDEDDLSAIASSFDAISQRADATAETLTAADQALAGNGDQAGDDEAQQADEQEEGDG